MEEAAASAGGGNGHTNGSWSVSALEVGTSNLAADDGSGRKGKEFASGTLWSGSSIFDSWLIASAAQVGFVMLTLPYSVSQMGLGLGISGIIFYGTLGAWAVYLLTVLYAEHNARSSSTETKTYTEKHILQYHEVIGDLTGKFMGRLTFVFIILALAFASCIQLIASASNMYYVSSRLNKQQWEFIVGGVAFLSVLLPNYGHLRACAIIGVFTTTFTSLYLVIGSLTHGQVAGVKHTGANHMVEFFTGATNVLFAFGGHGITVEILEAMKRPNKFKFVYPCVVLYTLGVVIPSSICVYWAFGDELLTHSNALSVLPTSSWRSTALIFMVIHQGIAFVITVTPVFYVCEKAAGVHTNHYFRRILVRVFVVGAHWFVALAVPFFGPINSVLGALLVTVGVYIIPLLAFNIVYRTNKARENSVLRRPASHPSWALIFVVNTFFILWIVVVGMGIGGWASITNFVRQINTFGFFDKCYQCPKSTKA